MGGPFICEAPYAGEYNLDPGVTEFVPDALLVQFTEDLPDIHLGTGIVPIA